MTDKFEYDYPMFMGAATVIVMQAPETFTDDPTHILIGKRKETSKAYPGFWCLPGGMINATVENGIRAAQRELFEETGLAINTCRLKLFYDSSNPKTDPRGHVINLCYSLYVDNEDVIDLKAGDDLTELRWASFQELRDMKLAFDHNEIVEQANIEFLY